MLEKGEGWLRQRDSLLRSRAPLKRLRDLPHAGLRLPLEVPEVEALRVDIRRREWEEAAKRALATKNTLAALLEVAASAADMGADDSSLAASLRAKIAA